RAAQGDGAPALAVARRSVSYRFDRRRRACKNAESVSAVVLGSVLTDPHVGRGRDVLVLGLPLRSELPGWVGGREEDTFLLASIGEPRHAPHLLPVALAVTRHRFDDPQLIGLAVVEQDIRHRVIELNPQARLL